MLIGRNVKRGWRLDTIPRRYCRSRRRNLDVQEARNVPSPRGRVTDKELARLLNRQSLGREMLITEAVEDPLDHPAIGATTRP
jgi:hypothetical protein